MPSEPLHRNTPSELPFLSLDADGEVLPDDWYLRICGRAAHALNKGKPLAETFPRKELEEFFEPQANYITPSTGSILLEPPPIPARPSAAALAESCAVAPALAPPVLPPRPHSRQGRMVPPIPEGGMLHAPPPQPPSHSYVLPEHGISTDSQTSSSRHHLENVRHQATTLFNKAATPERKKEAGQAWDQLTTEVGKLATPQRQQKVMGGVAKLGSKGAQLLDSARKKAAEREL
jgi:hypothetical protein